MFFTSDVTSDLLLARSDKRIRWGAVVPPLGFCLIALTGRLLTPGRDTFIFEMVALAAVGQTLVWWGIYGLHRTRAWASGVQFYLWVGGIFTAISLASTGIVYLAPIPLLAPATAWLAKVRLRRKPPAEAAR
ncbi:hypothetical protein ACFZAM_06190 [Streptomyces sp. NPDC008079]|uniref:hypothetical protein n=1 Tax=Streptomyces sp. NPDC008079 TaxID=3364806 RepID=UPI0036ED115A